MRDRHTPRVLLLPRDGSFACPEQACEESNARWKTIATAMRHVKRCTHVLQRGTLYCSTLTGTKSAKITPEEQRERNRAAAKKSNARVQAKARAKAQAKARAQAAARRAGKETADDDAMSNLPSAGSKADADADDVRVRGSDIQCTQVNMQLYAVCSTLQYAASYVPLVSTVCNNICHAHSMMLSSKCLCAPDPS